MHYQEYRRKSHFKIELLFMLSVWKSMIVSLVMLFLTFFDTVCLVRVLMHGDYNVTDVKFKSRFEGDFFTSS